MKCKVCGAENPKGSNFCNKCGANLAGKVIEVNCPYCGSKNSYTVPHTVKVWNPHRWDGPAKGSFWRGCSEMALSCYSCNKKYHVDCGN